MQTHASLTSTVLFALAVGCGNVEGRVDTVDTGDIEEASLRDGSHTASSTDEPSASEAATLAEGSFETPVKGSATDAGDATGVSVTDAGATDTAVMDDEGATDGSEDGAQKATLDGARDGSEDAPRDAPRDARRDAPQDAPQDAPRDAPRDAPKDAPRD